MPTTKTILPSRESVHGFFSKDIAPIVTIDSGESVVMQTLNAGWHRDPDPTTGHWHHEEHVPWYDPEIDQGHALCGPIFIRGARPGSVLEIGIDEVIPGSWGWSLGGGFANDRNQALGVAEGTPFGDFWTLDTERSVAGSRGGFRLAMAPFLGVMGMPPDEPGRHSTGPPRVTGGNIDCKELVAGTKLYLPVAVEGGLFSAGDGHAVQGDGEVSGVAIECPMDRVLLRLTVRDDLSFEAPRAWTPQAWITFGFDEDLDRAALMATNGMLDLIAEQLDIERKYALSLASLAVDLRVTQIVNGVKGVHAMLAHDYVVRA